MLALLDQHLLDLGGTYGDAEVGDPVQYDELRIEHDETGPGRRSRGTHRHRLGDTRSRAKNASVAPWVCGVIVCTHAAPKPVLPIGARPK